MAEVFGFDCYAPREIAEHVENVGVTKANLPLLSQVALGVLAGGSLGWVRCSLHSLSATRV